MAERFSENGLLKALPGKRYDTAYLEVSPGGLGWIRGREWQSLQRPRIRGQTGDRLGLDDAIRIFAVKTWLPATSCRTNRPGGIRPEHHAELWKALKVEQRPLAAYAEVPDGANLFA